MDKFVLEICERKQYVKTMKILKQQIKTGDSLQRLEKFIVFKKKMNKTKILKPINKLSFEINMEEEDPAVSIVKVDKFIKEWV